MKNWLFNIPNEKIIHAGSTNEPRERKIMKL